MNLFTLLFVQLLFVPSLVQADIPDGYRKVAKDYSIPVSLLYSVALQESEKPGVGKPWPWTINYKGKGIYFKSRNELFNYADNLVEKNEFNFDLGLMQVNWRWNSGYFRSLWSATDPYINLNTGAKIIYNYYRKSKSFEDAIGKYHAPNNKENAEKYVELVRYKLSLVNSGER